MIRVDIVYMVTTLLTSMYLRGWVSDDFIGDIKEEIVLRCFLAIIAAIAVAIFLGLWIKVTNYSLEDCVCKWLRIKKRLSKRDRKLIDDVEKLKEEIKRLKNE